MKIAKLEELFASARVIDESQIDTETVQILTRVKLKNIATGKTMEYTLVSEREADLKSKKLSIGTPIAKAIIGKKKGEVVEVEAPAGKMKLEIVDIAI